MSTSIGDKLGFTVPTDGGDDDVWGGVLHTFYAVLDELTYSAREAKNLSILGGGAISWDDSTNQVSFTENIIIRDHVTDKTVTITTAASPVTLSAQNTVGYVSKNPQPASNQSITSVSTVAAGSLPNTTGDTDMQLIVLFMRTSDDTLLIPWARREILSGDHWQWGASLSWYERIASSRKPSYYNDGSDTSQLTVPGSATAPSVVIIDGKLYVNVNHLYHFSCFPALASLN